MIWTSRLLLAPITWCKCTRPSLLFYFIFFNTYMASQPRIRSEHVRGCWGDHGSFKASLWSSSCHCPKIWRLFTLTLEANHPHQRQSKQTLGKKSHFPWTRAFFLNTLGVCCVICIAEHMSLERWPCFSCWCDAWLKSRMTEAINSKERRRIGSIWKLER